MSLRTLTEPARKCLAYWLARVEVLEAERVVDDCCICHCFPLISHTVAACLDKLCATDICFLMSFLPDSHGNTASIIPWQIAWHILAKNIGTDGSTRCLINIHKTDVCVSTEPLGPHIRSSGDTLAVAVMIPHARSVSLNRTAQLSNSWLALCPVDTDMKHIG